MKSIFTPVWLVLLLLVHAPAYAESFTLESSLARAVEHNRSLKASEEEAQARHDEARSLFGRFFPMARVEVNAMVWDSDNEYNFDLSEYEQLFGQMMGTPVAMPPMSMVVRNQVTVKSQVMLIQPLIQLYKIYEGYQARRAMSEAGRYDVQNERRKLEQEVTQTYFAYLGAQQMVDSVKQALVQVQTFEKQTQDYLDAGLVEREALLKVQVQREELLQAQAQAEKGVKLSRAMLNMYMGRDLHQPIEAAYEKSPDPQTNLAHSLKAQQAVAMDKRPDLLSARSQRRAAKGAYNAAIGEMLPELNLVGAYTNNQGMGDMMLDNEFFGGLMLTWNAWEWGATYYQVKSAKARHRKAVKMIEAAEEGIRLEVEQKRLELEEAIQSHKTAEAKLALAQESLRLEQNRYETQQASAADLVSAQTGELRARNDQTVAAMKVEVARRALLLAQGQDLLGSPAKSESTQAVER